MNLLLIFIAASDNFPLEGMIVAVAVYVMELLYLTIVRPVTLSQYVLFT